MQKRTTTIALLAIIMATGCEKPNPQVPQYQRADWEGINKLIHHADEYKIKECIKNKLTCQPASEDALKMVKSMEFKK
jgi:hypothetical protein